MGRIDPQHGVPASVVSQEPRVQGYSPDNSATKEIMTWADVDRAAGGGYGFPPRQNLNLIIAMLKK